jgi:site-specific DNA recombinase
VQERLGIHGTSGGRKNRVSRRRLLTGLLKCGVCGSGMTVNGGGDGRSRVLCSRHRESASCTHKRSYYLDTIEKIVVEVLRKALSDPGALHTFIDAYVAERRKLNAEIAKQYNRAEANLLKARAALDRGIDALIDGRISKEEWTKRRPELDARVGQAEREMAICKTPAKVDLHPEALRQYRAAIDSLHELLGQDAIDADNKLLEAFRDLVHSVVVHEVEAGSPVRVEIFGKLSALTGEPVCKMAVAGAGFEPAAFRL